MGSDWKSRPSIATRLLMLACMVEMLARPALAQRTQSSSSTSQYDFAAVRAYINKTIGEKQLPSVSVALAKDGKIIWEEAFGWADREKMIPATPGTMYALASLTKPYTSTGVMELVEQHKIDLDHPINEYLGSAPLTAIVGDPSDATVRRVLCHTSGLPIHSVNLLGNGAQVPPMADTIRRYGNVGKSPRPVLRLFKSWLRRARLYDIACFAARLEGLYARQSLPSIRPASHERRYRTWPGGLCRRKI